MSTPYEENLDKVFEEIKEMLLRKHHDYGTENLKRHGQYGILVRIDDKTARLKNLLTKEAEVKESIEDTFFDIVGYAIQAIMLLNEEL